MHAIVIVGTVRDKEIADEVALKPRQSAGRQEWSSLRDRANFLPMPRLGRSPCCSILTAFRCRSFFFSLIVVILLVYRFVYQSFLQPSTRRVQNLRKVFASQAIDFGP